MDGDEYIEEGEVVRKKPTVVKVIPKSVSAMLFLGDVKASYRVQTLVQSIASQYGRYRATASCMPTVQLLQLLVLVHIWLPTM